MPAATRRPANPPTHPPSQPHTQSPSHLHTSSYPQPATNPLRPPDWMMTKASAFVLMLSFVCMCWVVWAMSVSRINSPD